MGDPNTILHCSTHGKGYATFICLHLAKGSGLGFFYGNEDDPRPDAWCENCDRVLAQNGGEWNDVSVSFAKVTMICANCYDQVRLCNEMPFKRIPPQKRPTLEKDGWELDSAAHKHRLHPDTFKIPSEDDLRQLKTGDIAKLLFLFVDKDNQINCERMWVRVTEIQNEIFKGILETNPVKLTKLKPKTKIEFQQQHIASIVLPPGRHQTSTSVKSTSGFKESSWKENDAYY